MFAPMQIYNNEPHVHFHHATAAAYTMPTPPAATERHIMAERYKTKMCRNYLATGACPYETRCMFAHGEHELRTPEMNLRDGLITEEAIKAYQRVLHMRQLGNSPTTSAAPSPRASSSSIGSIVSSCNKSSNTFTHNPYRANAAQAIMSSVEWDFDDVEVRSNSSGSESGATFAAPSKFVGVVAP